MSACLELERGRFRSLASLILVVNVVGELQQKRTLAASHGFLAAARLSCFKTYRPNRRIIFLLRSTLVGVGCIHVEWFGDQSTDYRFKTVE